MALKDYILTLSSERTTERALMIDRIARECGVHTSTIYKWINGKTTPDILKQKKVSEITGLSVDKLFNKESK
ncbi:MAG: helix-turn-helix protein [Bacteroidetes bacterium]|nr:helix-turn-helix protein [Bacteroidota bacterium]